MRVTGGKKDLNPKYTLFRINIYMTVRVQANQSGFDPYLNNIKESLVFHGQ